MDAHSSLLESKLHVGFTFPILHPQPLPGVLHRIDANCLHVVIRSQTGSATLRAQTWTNPHKLCHVTLGLSQPLSWPQFLHLRNRKMICKVLFLSDIKSCLGEFIPSSCHVPQIVCWGLLSSFSLLFDACFIHFGVCAFYCDSPLVFKKIFFHLLLAELGLCCCAGFV